MTDLTMSQFASKDDLIAAQAARIAELEAEVDAERHHHGIRNASAVRTLHALGYSWRGTDAWQPPAEQGKCLHQIAEPQPEALRLAAWLLHRGMSGIKQNDIEASNQLRWLHAESLQHQQELAAYRFTVENREARIAELEKENSYLNNACAELESQLEAIGAGGVEPLRKGFVRLTDVLARLEQGFGANSAPVTTIKRHFEMQAAPAQHAITTAACRAGSVYVSGPMTGYADWNFPAFNAAAAALRAQGLQVINPTDHGVVDGAEWADYLRTDLAQLAACERIHLLPGWSKSKGAKLELHVAQALGLQITLAEGAEPLGAAAPQAVQAEVPEAIEQMAVDRYKVVPSHESMFHRWAVVAGNGTQQLYIGREVECLNMARKFAGAFLDGAFVAMQNTAPAYPAEGVHAAVIAGAIFDFAGHLTTLPHEKALHCSEAHEASPMVEAITEWCKRRGLRTDGARVETWRAALAAQAKQGEQANG